MDTVIHIVCRQMSAAFSTHELPGQAFKDVLILPTYFQVVESDVRSRPRCGVSAKADLVAR